MLFHDILSGGELISILAGRHERLTSKRVSATTSNARGEVDPPSHTVTVSFDYLAAVLLSNWRDLTYNYRSQMMHIDKRNVLATIFSV